MTRLSIAAAALSALVLAAPTSALACRFPNMTPEERAVEVTTRQTEAWNDAALVYLAEVVTYEVGPEDGWSSLGLAPLLVLKGDGTPERETVAVKVGHRECERDVFDIEEFASPGSRFVVYVGTGRGIASHDLYTQDLQQVRDPSALAALSGFGWMRVNGVLGADWRYLNPNNEPLPSDRQ